MAQSLSGAESLAAHDDDAFNQLALASFSLQFQHNNAYHRWCDGLGVFPQQLKHWSEVPALPTSAFKELDVTSLTGGARTRVFHSSGTTEQRPGRHFHHAESLALYEASLVAWFRACLFAGANKRVRILSLTPPASAAPHSSLVHMFETVGREFGSVPGEFFGATDATGAWSLAEARLAVSLAAAIEAGQPVLMLGTAFNYVHLADAFERDGKAFHLPPGSRALETGGYKGRSRSLEKAGLHRLIGERLGLSAGQIVCEYGMSELGSQAYDVGPFDVEGATPRDRRFQFPPWARVRIVSPETGREVDDGQRGLVRVFDLANLWSVSAVQTEDLAIRRGTGFELLGRAAATEARGCSLMSLNG